MRIIAFNGSPRMENGATDIVLNKFLDGAKHAGAEIEKVYLAKKRINRCVGCYGCWTKTPGVCVQKDDMGKILQKMRESGLWVFATPLYTDTMNSYTKILLERTLPRLQPFLTKYENRTRHPLRHPEEENKHKIVVISVCGFPERSHFEALGLTFKKISINAHAPVVGEIYLPGSQLLFDKSGRRLVNKFLANVFNAGREIVENGKISEKTLKEINKEVKSPKFLYRWAGNRRWKKQIKTLA
jgi:multimeric flavodoxin WrbA